MRTFEQYCEFRKTPNGIIMSPIQLGKWLVLFCDEINLPDYDEYGKCMLDLHVFVWSFLLMWSLQIVRAHSTRDRYCFHKEYSVWFLSMYLRWSMIGVLLYFDLFGTHAQKLFLNCTNTSPDLNFSFKFDPISVKAASSWTWLLCNISCLVSLYPFYPCKIFKVCTALPIFT